jgi:hypothetical protein
VLWVLRPRVNEENRTPCSVGHDHLPLHPAPSTTRAHFALCIREVLTLRLPRCERGALPLSYGCVEPAGRAREPFPRASPALGRPASCRTRSSAVSERRRHRLTPGRKSSSGHRAFRKPDLRRVVPTLCVWAMCPWWSWVVSIRRLARFRRALSQLSYTTIGPASGLEPGSTGLQGPCPSSWARPALLERRWSCRVVRRCSFISVHEVQSPRRGVGSRRYRGKLRRSVGRRLRAVLGNDELQPIVSH